MSRPALIACRELVAQAYCTPENSGKVMDVELVEAIAQKFASCIRASVIQIQIERLRHEKLGFTAADDDRNTFEQWQQYIALYAGCVVGPRPGYEDTPRSSFIKVAAIALAAIDSIDRKAQK